MSDITLIEIPYQDSPLLYMEALLDLPRPILFDSGRPGSNQGRYDILSAAPTQTITLAKGSLNHSEYGAQSVTGSLLLKQLNHWLSKILIKVGLPQQSLPFYGGFAGYFSYDAGRLMEKLPAEAEADIDLPEIQIGFYPWSAVIDHHEKKAWLSCLPCCPSALKKDIIHRLTEQKITAKNKEKFKLIKKLQSNFNVNSYSKKIKVIKDYILSGDCYQVNFSQRFSAPYSGNTWEAYKELRKSMFSPFGGYLSTYNDDLEENSAILCFSPERFLQLRGANTLTQPIKGTAKREPDKIKDKLAALTLLNSEKNRAENLMIVDLLRNDLGKCCETGSVMTEKLFELQTVSNVHHLVSTIKGTLQRGKTAYDLLVATFPGGSITGTPKIRAMEIIEELEPQRRSIYCGSLFYININGDMDSNITIRTVLCHKGKVHCWGGGGIVADSEAEAEYQESLVKIAPLLKALENL